MSKQILIELVGENETGYCYATFTCLPVQKKQRKQEQGQLEFRILWYP